MTVRQLGILTAALLSVAACHDGRAVVDGATGSAGRSTGSAGSSATGSAGSSATGSAGSSATGSAGSSATGGARGSTDGGAGVETDRFLFIFYTAHGTVLDAWRPSGTTGNLTLSPILQPLGPYQDRVTVIDGLDNISAPGHPASTHVDGPSALLTARSSGGPSVDYVFAPSGAEVAFPDPVAGVEQKLDFVAVGPQWINYSPQGIELIGTRDPRNLEQNLFVGSGTQPLSTIPDPSDYIGMGRADVQIAAQAFAAGLTHVLTEVWTTPGSILQIAGTGMTYRQLAEASGTSPAREQFIAEQVVFAGEVANLAAVLDQITLAPGVTLLDRSAILWISETGEASTHSGTSIPVVLVGNLGGALRQGQVLRYTGRSQGDLMLTLARAVGQTTFGDPAIATRPLDELLAP